MSGNDAVSEAAIQAGCRYYYGYPITPQSEISEYMAKRMPEVQGNFVQSESEVAAINMLFGSAAAGGRAMTSSSGLGITLKQEGICFLASCELPGVIVNMMRGGPGLGNIGPGQSDYIQATRGGGHGDYHTIVLGPNSVQEMADLTFVAFDLADKYRNPVMLLCDGVMAQMMEPTEISRKEIIEVPAKDWALTGCKDRKPNVIRSLYLEEKALENHNNRLQEKYKKIRESECRWENYHADGADLLLVAYGTSSRLCRAAMATLHKEGYRVGLMRPISLWPFPEQALRDLTTPQTTVLAVEMSYGQMVDDVRLALNGKCDVRFFGRGGGEVLTVEEVLANIRMQIAEKHIVPTDSTPASTPLCF